MPLTPLEREARRGATVQRQVCPHCQRAPRPGAQTRRFAEGDLWVCLACRRMAVWRMGAFTAATDVDLEGADPAFLALAAQYMSGRELTPEYVRVANIRLAPAQEE